MSRENKYTGIVLKKQPFNEGDEIISLFTKERGKMRVLAKSVKLSGSKMQQRLQSLFLLELTLTAAGALPKIIAAEPIKVFANLRQSLSALKASFYALELALKFTPDEHKNQALFNLLSGFLEFLDSQNPDRFLNLGLAKFKMEMLQVSGFGVHHPKDAEIGAKVYFSPLKGGFTSEKPSGSLPVPEETYKIFTAINRADFSSLAQIPIAENNLNDLQRLLSMLIEYHLERKVKSEKYLQSGDMV